MGGLKLNLSDFYTETLPKILFLYAIVIDSINGALQSFMGLHLPIGILFRGLVLVLVLSKGFYLPNNRFNLFFRVMVCLYVVAMMLWSVFSINFSLSIEANILFKFVYFFVVIFYFYSYRDKMNKEQLVRYVVFAAFIIALLNIFCFRTGYGVLSYDDEFGFGTKAFYADGNSLGLYMILSICLSIWYAYYKRNIFLGLIAVVITAGTMLIGTRAALLGSLISWSILVVSFTIFRDGIIRIPSWKKIVVIMLVALGIIFVVIPALTYVVNFDAFTANRFTGESIVSPRESLIESGKRVIDKYEGLELVIGNGTSGGLRELGETNLAEEGMKSIEADFYDQILSYGWGLGVLMILLNLVLFWQCVRPVFRHLNSLTYTVAMMAGIWLGAAYMAGHGFSNTMLAPLFGVMLVVISDKGNDFRRVKQ